MKILFFYNGHPDDVTMNIFILSSCVTFLLKKCF
jgi:hypothetical protein